MQPGGLGALHSDMDKVLPMRLYGPCMTAIPVSWAINSVAKENAETFLHLKSLDKIGGLQAHHSQIHGDAGMNERTSYVFTEQQLDKLSEDIPDGTLQVLPKDTDHKKLCCVMIFHRNNTLHSRGLGRTVSKNFGVIRTVIFRKAVW